MPRYKVVFVPEWCLCPARPVLMVGVYGLVVVRGLALFVVFGVLYYYPLNLLSLVIEVLVRIPAFRAARSFKNGAALGSTYVQPRIGWYWWLYSMCIVARRDFVLFLVGVKKIVCEYNRSRGTNLTSEPNARATAPYVQAKIRARFGGTCGRACSETASANNEGCGRV